MAALGPEGFGPVAIEEWMGASPIYSRRMQKALRFEGDSVETIFKGMQFDIGAPPQFLDFRYELHDRDHGEFWLDHCGALVADVRLEEWSHSALVRIAQEICLEGHLLSLSFAAALQRRVTGEVVVDFARRQFTGAAGVAADRIRAALGLGTELDDLARILE